MIGNCKTNEDFGFVIQLILTSLLQRFLRLAHSEIVSIELQRFYLSKFHIYRVMI